MPRATFSNRDITMTVNLDSDDSALRLKKLLDTAFAEAGGWWAPATQEGGQGLLQWFPAGSTSVTIKLDGDLSPDLKPQAGIVELDG